MHIFHMVVKNIGLVKMEIKKKFFTGQVVNFNRVFLNKRNFNADIGYWDMSSAVVTAEMFKGARNFNQDISDWDLSSNKWFWGMFYNARKFNQDISGWDTSNARSFSTMFRHAYAFNQDIGSWDTSQVATMYQMFRAARKFNQDIGGWNTSSITNFKSMFMVQLILIMEVAVILIIGMSLKLHKCGLCSKELLHLIKLLVVGLLRVVQTEVY